MSRPIELPHGGKVLLVDTVGFIRKLPHELVKAFRATLEEARLADVLIMVLDGADAQMEGRRRTVEEVLDSLGATEAPRVEAVNKCDLIAPDAQSLPGALYISASTGENVEKLLLRVESEAGGGRAGGTSADSLQPIRPGQPPARHGWRAGAAPQRGGRGNPHAHHAPKCKICLPGRGKGTWRRKEVVA